MGVVSDPSYPAFPVISALGFVLVLIPLPWHLQAWNSGTCLYMIWTAIASLNLFVNSIVWHGNALNSAPIWCEISSRIIIAGAVAIPSASLCINRRLYQIASVRTVSVTRADKRRALLVDLAIGIGLPLLEVVLAYVVTGHRFDIYEDIGCQPAIYLTPVTFPLVLCWPIAIGLVSAVYCVLSLRAFGRRRAEFAEFLSSHSSLSVSRYFRLMALAGTDLLFTVPISAYGIYLNVSDGGISPWISWSDTHFDYSRIGQYPSVIWRMDRQGVISFELSRWLVPFCAFVFFAFFGFAAEARKNYRAAALAILKSLHLKVPAHSSLPIIASKPTLPNWKPSLSLPAPYPAPPSFKDLYPNDTRDYETEKGSPTAIDTPSSCDYKIDAAESPYTPTLPSRFSPDRFDDTV